MFTITCFTNFIHHEHNNKTIYSMNEYKYHENYIKKGSVLKFPYNFWLSKRKESNLVRKGLWLIMLHSTSLQAIFLPLYSWKRDDEGWGDLIRFKLKRNHQSF